MVKMRLDKYLAKCARHPLRSKADPGRAVRWTDCKDWGLS